MQLLCEKCYFRIQFATIQHSETKYQTVLFLISSHIAIRVSRKCIIHCKFSPCRATLLAAESVSENLTAMPVKKRTNTSLKKERHGKTNNTNSSLPLLSEQMGHQFTQRQSRKEATHQTQTTGNAN